MLNLVKRLFKGTSLYSLHEDQEYQLFALSCAKRSFYLFGMEDQPGIPVDDLTQEALLEYTEKYSDFKDDDFTPFTHEGRIAIFSSMEKLEGYTGEYSKSRDKVFAFQTVNMILGELCETVICQNVGIIIDPDCLDEIVLSEGARRSLLG